MYTGGVYGNFDSGASIHAKVSGVLLLDHVNHEPDLSAGLGAIGVLRPFATAW